MFQSCTLEDFPNISDVSGELYILLYRQTQGRTGMFAL